MTEGSFYIFITYGPHARSGFGDTVDHYTDETVAIEAARQYSLSRKLVISLVEIRDNKYYSIRKYENGMGVYYKTIRQGALESFKEEIL